MMAGGISSESLEQQDDLLERKYDKMPFGAEVRGEDDTTWSKGTDDLWDAGYGIRMNSKALLAHTRPIIPELKLKKGMTKNTTSLF